MPPTVIAEFQHQATVLFASVVLLVAVFLIARVGRVRQPLALALALGLLPLVIILEHAPAIIGRI